MKDQHKVVHLCEEEEKLHIFNDEMTFKFVISDKM